MGCYWDDNRIIWEENYQLNISKEIGAEVRHVCVKELVDIGIKRILDKEDFCMEF